MEQITLYVFLNRFSHSKLIHSVPRLACTHKNTIIVSYKYKIFHFARSVLSCRTADLDIDLK